MTSFCPHGCLTPSIVLAVNSTKALAGTIHDARNQKRWRGEEKMKDAETGLPAHCSVPGPKLNTPEQAIAARKINANR